MVGGEKVSCLNLQVCKRKLIQKLDFEYYKVYNRGQMTEFENVFKKALASAEQEAADKELQKK